MDFNEIVEDFGKGVDGFGVAIIIVGAILATGFFVVQMRHGGPVDAAYRKYRRSLGRAILLGLEFLVAGDIIRTVAATPTFRSVGILAAIVAIRTFLSTELELEIDGRWPWQRRADESGTLGEARGGADAPQSQDP
jgi:uncharacterized membrane protein